MSVERDRETRGSEPRYSPETPAAAPPGHGSVGRNREEDRRDMHKVPAPEGIAPPCGATGATGESGIPGTRPNIGPEQVPGHATLHAVVAPNVHAPPLQGNQFGKSVGGMGGGAAGAVGGALIGSVIGPAGTVLGGMIGAVAGAAAGALAGKVGADVFNPNTDTEHWENNFVEKPYYVRGFTFADYEPAYRYGWEQCQHHGGHAYTADALRDGWERARGYSRLTWEQAEPAVRDAWDRMCERLED